MRGKLTFAIILGGLLFPAASTFASDPADGQLTQDTKKTKTFVIASGRSYLGIDIQDVTPERLSALKLKEERGVEVTMVDQDAPAGKAGVKEHDVITEFNGTKVESGEQLRRLIRETPPGRTVALGISRDGNPMTINVQLGDRGKIAAEYLPQVVVPRPMPPMPEITIPNFEGQFHMYSSPYLGVQIESVGRQLGEYFGIKDGEGILVKSVEKNSPAEKAGLKAGDIIVKADNEKTPDRSDLRRIMHNHRNGGKVTLGIVRDRKEQNITVDVPERKSKDSSEIYFELPDFNGDFDDIQETLREIGPEVARTRQMMIRDVEPKMRLAIAASTRASQQALRQAESQLQRVQQRLRLDMCRAEL